MRTSKWVKSFQGFGGENSKNMCVATDLDKFVGKCGRIYHGIVEKMAKFTNQTVGFLPRQIAFCCMLFPGGQLHAYGLHEFPSYRDETSP